MFDQSSLLDHAPGRKTSALAASVTVQTLIVGSLFLIPLVYTDRLPDVRMLIAMPLVSPPPPLPPEPVPEARPTPSRIVGMTLARPIVYRLATPAMPIPSVIEFAPPPVPDGVVFGSLPALPGSQFSPHISATVAPPILPIEVSNALDQPVTVGGKVQEAKLIRKIVPEYPPIARSVGVSGTVRLIRVVAKNGTIQQLRVESGHPLLVRAAIAAVRQWIYRPTLLNGEPVEVIAPIDVVFTLTSR